MDWILISYLCYSQRHVSEPQITAVSSYNPCSPSHVCVCVYSLIYSHSIFLCWTFGFIQWLWEIWREEQHLSEAMHASFALEMRLELMEQLIQSILLLLWDGYHLLLEQNGLEWSSHCLKTKECQFVFQSTPFCLEYTPVFVDSSTF